MSIWRRFVQAFQKARTTHVNRTANSFRQKNMIKGEIDNLSRLSTNVRALTIKFPTKISFKAGQWVDLMVPGMDEIGGFSICSAPYEMEENNTLQLAVKYVENTPAEWCHRCTLKSEVAIRVGGDFFFEPSKDLSTKKILLIAGGVGINPLHSIIKETLHEDEKNDMKRDVFLMYSAKSELDILFKDDLLDLCADYENFQARFYVTVGGNWSQNILINPRRLNVDDIKFQLENHLSTKIFICGPPPMMNFIIDCLNRLNFPKENIFFEKWW